MNEDPERFEYARFVALSGSLVVDYAEKFVADPGMLVSEEDLRTMLGVIDTLDEYHLVYAIELGVNRLPSEFAPVIPRYLVHSALSVRLAASRAIRRFPSACVTKEVLASARYFAARCPEDMTSELEALTKRGSASQ